MIDYINKGDPVANLGSDSLLSKFIVPAGTQFHYGTITYVGSDVSGKNLTQAAQVLFTPKDEFDMENGVGAAALLGAYVVTYHAFATYAAVLGTGIAASLPSASDPDVLVNAGILAANYKLLEGKIGDFTGEGGATFQGLTSAQFSKSRALVTTAQNSNGGFDNVLFQSPTAFKGVGAGTLDIVQTSLKEQVVFKAGAWKSVQFQSGKLEVALKSTAQAHGASTLSFDSTTGAINIDHSTLTLSNIKSLQVSAGEDATNFDILDPTSGKTKGAIIVGGGTGQNATLASNVSGITADFAAGTDTLFHFGPNSTIDVGGGADDQAAKFALTTTANSLLIGTSSTDAISLAGIGFIQNGGSLTGGAGSTSLVVVADAGQKATATGTDILVAAGTNDTLAASQSGQKLIALGQSGDVLNGQTTDKSGIDKLIAVAGNLVSGAAPAAGNDTLNAGIGNNIMIGEGVNTTFNINSAANPKAIDVVWGKGGSDTINISGSAAIFVINAPGATLASVKNLDLQKLSQQIWREEGVLDQGDLTFSDEHDPRLPPSFSEPAVFVINPTADDKLVINGQSLSGDISNSVRQSGAVNSSDYYPNSISFLNQINYNVVEFFSPILGDRLTSWIMGFSPGNFGITNASGTLPEDVDSSSMLANGTPTVNLANFQTQASTNASGGSGGGSDPSVIDQASVFLTNVSDTLLSIGAATAFGTRDTLVAANGADTLTASGDEDTLIGNGAGSTLVNNGGRFSNNVVAYTIDDVTVDLGTFGSKEQSARINGSSSRDTLVKITRVEALGTNDTLISRRSDSTLTAITAGNTLIGSSGATLLGTGVGSTLICFSGVTWYKSLNSVVNLATGTANVGGASTSDTLIGVQNVVLSGLNSVVVGGNGGDTLTASGASETLIAGTGVETLTTSGQNNTLIGGSGADYLFSTGFHNTLIAGTGANILSSNGFDTLIGNGAGSQLLTSSGGVAAYMIDNVVIDLGANRATIQGASVSDTLQNIRAGEALGSHDTVLGGSSTSTLIAAGSQDVLEAGSGITTLISNVNGNTLVAGTGQTTANYSTNNVTINLAAGTAFVNGSSTVDTLIGINSATVSGQQDTVIGGSVADVLIAGFLASGDTLIAGSGAETLISNFSSGNTLIGGTGSDTLSSSGSGDVLLAGDGSSETLSSSGNSNTLIAGAGVDSLSTSGSGDTLLGGSGASVLSASGSDNSLVAGSGISTLIATGVDNTLFGIGGGSTLDGTGGTGAIAAYTANDVTINLAVGTAGVNGSGAVDTLLGISAAAALGSNDTIVDGDAGSTLFSDAAGNTLVGGNGGTVAAYKLNNLTVDLSTGIAGVNGTGVSDTLIGIAAVAVSGSHDTVLAGRGANVLSSSGSSNTLVAGDGADTLSSSGSSNTLVAGDGADTLSSTGTGNTLIGGTGADTLSSSGTNDILIGGNGANVITSSGSGNSLLAGSGIGALFTSGSGDTLFGTGNGSTLDATNGIRATAAYTANDVVIDVGAGTATVAGMGVSDTLAGFSTFAALGSNDTLMDGNSGSTLFSSASGNTLEGGTGETVAAYAGSGLAINLSAGTAGVNGATVSDTLIGIHAALASGSNDVLLGDSGNDLLSSSGSGNTLIAGTGIDTLLTTGTGDTLYGNLLGSTLKDKSFVALVVYTQSGATIDLIQGTAQLNGSSVSDELVGINTIQVLGGNDTLVGDGSTLISDAAGNTLIGGGTAGSTAVYETDNVTVNLITGTAAISGAGVADTLTNIFAVTVSGNNDTLISGGTGNTLAAANASDVVVYAKDNISVDLLAGTAGVNGTNAEDKLIGVSNVQVSGAGASVTGGMESGVLQARGSHDLLISGGVDETLIASGSDDTLVGNLAGSVLQSTQGATGTTVLYTYDDVTIDLGAGTAFGPVSSTSDALVGISAVTVSGAYDTVLAGSGMDTLFSIGSLNSLVGGSGADLLRTSGQNDVLIAGSGRQTLRSLGTANTLVAGGSADLLTTTGVDDSLVGNALGSTLDATGGVGAVAVYAIDNVTVDLGSGLARINGNSLADTITGITSAAVSGSGDTIIAGAANSVLSANGLNDKLIGGGGTNTLLASGSNDVLLAGNGVDLLSSSGIGNTLIAGSGADVLTTSGTGDLLQGGSSLDTLSSSGSGNTLVAGSGSNVLSSSGTDDTLIGNGAGSTLDGSSGIATVAVYALDNVRIDLAAGTASVNGSGISDTLVGISSAMASGTGETLIGGTGATTLYSNALGNTLEAGSGHTTVVYRADSVSVDLGARSATVNGSSAGDTLIGGTSAVISGANDTLRGGAGSETLISDGVFNTIIAGSGTDLLSSSGIGDTLIGGSGPNTLASSGQNNTLIAGSSSDLLVSTGFEDTLVGNAAGSTLDGTRGFNVLADYSLDDLVVDLGAGAATVNGSGVSDALRGIVAVIASGHHDTLIGGTLATRLSSNGNGNTLIAGAGETTVLYALDNVTVDLSASSATVNGSGIADALVGIISAVVAGADDTLIGGSGSEILSSSGRGNTLLAGSAADTLASAGFDDTLVGNGLGSTLDGSNGSGALAAYSLNNVTVDLGTGSATINGSGISDTLVGIGAALALGTGDTLIGGSGVTTLASNAAGNTLVTGSGQTVAAYDVDNAVVNLAAGVASVNGSSASDALIGVSAATVSGASDTLIGNGAGDLLTASGSNDVVFGGGGADTLVAQGTSDTLSAGAGASTLVSSGLGNVLIAGGSAADALISTGFDDTLYGNASGSTLDATHAVGAVAAYTVNNLTIDLSSGTARVTGASAFDTLLGVTEAAVLGTNDTLIAGLGDETLFGGGGANTYVYASADGSDVIEDAGSSSQAVFSDIASTGVIFSVSAANSNDLLITINGTGKTLTVEGQFSASGVGELQDFTFADGVILNAGQVAALAGAGSATTLMVDVSIDRTDTTAPTITKVVSLPATGDVTTGHVVKITLTPSEAVTVSGTPELLLNDGGIASYDAAHSTTKALVFNYMVAAGDSTPNLAVSGIELPTGASTKDLAGNSAVLAGAATSLGVQINTTTSGSSGPEAGNITLSGSSNAELFGPSSANVIFDSGSNGTLRLDASSQFTGTVAGLALGNYVDLADLAYRGNDAPVYSSSGANTGSVAVTEGTTTINVALLGGYLANSFVASSDGHGGTLITDPPSPPQVMLGPSLHV